jgi:integrase
MHAAQRVTQGQTLNDYAAKWLDERNIKTSTKIEYRRIYRQLIEPTIGKTPMRYLSAETVRSWYANMGNDTPRRRSHAYGLLSAITNTAQEQDHILTTKVCNIARASNVAPKRQPVILSINELAYVADSIQPPQLGVMVLIASWCGLRWGELIELRRKDIDDICETITVGRAATHRGRGCTIDTPKSGKGRTSIVPPHIRADLKHHLEVRVGKSPESLVFPALRDGYHFNDSVFAKHLAPVLKSIGREDMTIHHMRHFAGSQVARVTKNLREGMNRLGHSTPRAALIYLQEVDGRVREVAEDLSKLAER